MNSLTPLLKLLSAREQNDSNHDLHPKLSLEVKPDTVYDPYCDCDGLNPIYRFLNTFLDFDLSIFRPSWLAEKLLSRMESLSFKNLDQYRTYCESELGDNEKQLLINTLFCSKLKLQNHFDFIHNINYIDGFLSNHFAQRQSDEGFVQRIWIPWTGDKSIAYTLSFYIHFTQPAWVNYKKLKIIGTHFEDPDNTCFDIGTLHDLLTWYKQNLPNHFVDADLQSPLTTLHDQIRCKTLTGSHDLVPSNPYREIDLIICNYDLRQLHQSTRQQTIDCFNHSLQKNGLLWTLFPTEGYQISGFAPMPGQSNLFKKNRVLSPCELDTHTLNSGENDLFFTPNVLKILTNHKQLDLRLKYQSALMELLEKTAHPTILIDNSYDIIYTIGETSLFLKEQSHGYFTRNVHDLLTPTLFDLVPDIEAAFESEESKTIPTLHALKTLPSNRSGRHSLGFRTDLSNCWRVLS